MRKEVKQFAKAMERELRKHDGIKVPWLYVDSEILLMKAEKHMKLLRKVYVDKENECIDVANYVMMIFNKMKKKREEQLP